MRPPSKIPFLPRFFAVYGLFPLALVTLFACATPTADVNVGLTPRTDSTGTPEPQGDKDSFEEKVKSLTQKIFGGTTYRINEQYSDPARLPKRIAVLPFGNETKKQPAFQIIRKVFYNHMSSEGFLDMEIPLVDKKLMEHDLDVLNPEQLNKMKPSELAKILEVDGIIKGRILNFDKLILGFYNDVTVGAEVTLYDGRNDEIIWTADSKAVTYALSGPSIMGAIVAVYNAYRMSMEVQLLRTADDLFRDMVKTVPQPATSKVLEGPRIDFVLHDGVQPKKAGDRLRVAVQGEPHKFAYFHIGEFKKNIEMHETDTPGWYEGEYPVEPGDNVNQAVLAAVLRDEAGMSTTRKDVLQPIQFDTEPPQAPSDLRVVARSDRVQLQWKGSPSRDVAGYFVYRNDKPLSTGSKLNDQGTEFTELTDTRIQVGEKYFYRVSAFDRVGNESEPGSAIEALVVSPNQKAGGVIQQDTTWYRAGSPYHIEEAVTIAENTTLHIEPGTVVMSRGPGMRVKGVLHADGTPELPIVFTREAELPAGQKWDGLSFAQSERGESKVRFSQVKHARIGLLCDSASPEIAQSEIAQNETGIKILNAFSKPRVLNNTITDNEKYGISVAQNAEPEISGNDIRNNREAGIQLSNDKSRVAQNKITHNRIGLSLHHSLGTAHRNSIHSNETIQAASGEADAAPFDARENFWGSHEGLAVLGSIRGPVEVNPILTEEGSDKTQTLSILKGPLKGKILQTSYLVPANSPYILEETVVVDRGANLFIQPGVRIRFNSGQSLEVHDGSVLALGTSLDPIIFTANTSQAKPGYYESALVVKSENGKSSKLEFVIVEYAKVGVRSTDGETEINNSILRGNYTGILLENRSTGKASRNLFTQNNGDGAVLIRGMAQASIVENNFISNSFAIQNQNFTFKIDARNNYWGNDAGQNPDWDLLLIGRDNIEFSPWKNEPLELALK